MSKKKKIEKLEKVIKEAKKIREKLRTENGVEITRVPNKDLLFWLITQNLENRADISNNRFRIKVLFTLLMALLCAVGFDKVI
jgi:hypothetical protein